MKLTQQYGRSCKDATRALYRSPSMLAGSVACFLIYVVTLQIAPYFGYGGGFLLGIVELLLITTYYSWIRESASGTRVRFKDLIRFDQDLFFSFINAGFVLWLVTFLPEQILVGMRDTLLLMFLKIFLAIALNPLPEVLMTHPLPGTQSLLQTFTFARERFIPWFIHVVISLAPAIVLTGEGALALLAKTDPMFPCLTLLQSWGLGFGALEINAIVGSLLLVVVLTWYSLFRLFLYRLL